MSQSALPIDLPVPEEPTATTPEMSGCGGPARNQAEMMVRDVDSVVAEDRLTNQMPIKPVASTGSAGTGWN